MRDIFGKNTTFVQYTYHTNLWHIYFQFFCWASSNVSMDPSSAHVWPTGKHPASFPSNTLGKLTIVAQKMEEWRHSGVLQRSTVSNLGSRKYSRLRTEGLTARRREYSSTSKLLSTLSPESERTGRRRRTRSVGNPAST